MEICKWNRPVYNFAQINPKPSSISKWAKWKLAQRANLKSIFEKTILEVSQIDVFVFWTQFDPKGSFRRL